MAEDRSKLSNVVDVVGGLAAAGAIAVGARTAVNGINTLETLPPKTVPNNTEYQVQESPADIKRREAWQQIAAGGAGVVIGAGGLGVVLAGRREKQTVEDLTRPEAWKNAVSPEVHSAPDEPRIPAPQQQRWIAGDAAGSLKRDRERLAKSQQQQQ